jgi:endonuclease YncB( thermonuclease family)
MYRNKSLPEQTPPVQSFTPPAPEPVPTRDLVPNGPSLISTPRRDPQPSDTSAVIGQLDMEAVPDAPLAPQVTESLDGAKAGAPQDLKLATDTAGATGWMPSSASPADGAGDPPPLEPITLEHPKVLDTAKLQAGDTTVTLFGIRGLPGEAAQGLQAYLRQNDQPLICQAHGGSAFVCMMGDGTDVALVSLVNGAALTTSDAPEVYHQQEDDAQKNRRGVWSKLPPPPEMVKHPIVKDTATLTGDGKTYILDGIIGLGRPYNVLLQSYISANGDSMTCMPQGPRDHFVCLLPDGMDLAEVVLVNGAARVAPTATPAYRTQQAEAMNNRRGYWASAPPDVLALAVPPPSDQYAFEAGDEGVDGITYVNGLPLAVIDGEPNPVFMVYEDDLGWGYYGRDHFWHRAPDQIWYHLDHFHREGYGLLGYDRGHFASYGHDVSGRSGKAREGMVNEASLRAQHAASAEHSGGVRMARGGGGFAAGGFRSPPAASSMDRFHQGLFGGGEIKPAGAPHVASGGGGGGKHK